MEEKQEDLELLLRRNSQVQKPQSRHRMDIKTDFTSAYWGVQISSCALQTVRWNGRVRLHPVVCFFVSFLVYKTSSKVFPVEKLGSLFFDWMTDTKVATLSLIRSKLKGTRSRF